MTNFCEIDKYAVKAYCAIHGYDENLNLGNIKEVNPDEIEDFDLMTWGFPCTDISIVGKQQGFINQNGELTRSGLYYEGMKIIKNKRPKVSIIENVKNLTSNKFKNIFDEILNDFEDAGYNSYWKVLNSLDYGIPQNRERVFIVSIRKDIDNGQFHFPQPFDSGLRLYNLLDNNVPNNLYLNNENVTKYLNYIRLSDWSKENKLQQAGYIRSNSVSNRVYFCNVARTLLSEAGGGGAKTGWYVIPFEDKYKIRKLSPNESFRLMGFSDEDYLAARSVGLSSEQIYKKAGNSIVINVLFYIFLELYAVMTEIFDDLKVGSFFSGIGAYETALDKLYKKIYEK